MPRLKLNGENNVLEIDETKAEGRSILIRTKNDSRIGLFWRRERKNAKRERENW